MNCDSAKNIWGLILSQPKREILRAYLDCADEFGVSTASVQHIAWMTDYHERHVQRLTRALEADGLLLATLRRGKTTEYRFDLSKAAAKPAVGEGVTNVTPDTQIAPPEMSPLTPDSTGDIPTGDIQIAPPNVPAQARAEESLLNYLPDQSSFKDQELKAKDNYAAAARVHEDLPVRPNAYGVWEQEMTPLTPFIASTLKDWLETFPTGWVEDAIREAKMSGGRAPKYVQRILDRWQVEGKNAPRPAAVTGVRPPNRASPPPSNRQRDPALNGFDARQMVAEMERTGKNDKGWNPFTEEDTHDDHAQPAQTS